MEEQVEQKMNKNLLTLRKCEGPGGPAAARKGEASGVIGSFIGMGIWWVSVLELDSC